MYICPFVVNFDHFSRISIVIDHHPCIPNDRDTTNFTGMKPADMDMCIHAIRKFQVEVGYIFDVRLQMGMCLYLDPLRLFVEKIQQDGNIVWRQVPDDVDIISKEP